MAVPLPMSGLISYWMNCRIPLVSQVGRRLGLLQRCTVCCTAGWHEQHLTEKQLSFNTITAPSLLIALIHLLLDRSPSRAACSRVRSPAWCSRLWAARLRGGAARARRPVGMPAAAAELVFMPLGKMTAPANHVMFKVTCGWACGDINSCMCLNAVDLYWNCI